MSDVKNIFVQEAAYCGFFQINDIGQELLKINRIGDI